MASPPPGSPTAAAAVVSPPSAPHVAIASPPSGSPTAAEEEGERPWPPPMKMKLAPYAMYCVFNGMTPRGGIYAGSYFGLHCVLYTVKFLILTAGADWAGFWGPVHSVVQCLCLAATTLIICAFIRWYMAVDGVYVVEFERQRRRWSSSHRRLRRWTCVRFGPIEFFLTHVPDASVCFAGLALLTQGTLLMRYNRGKDLASPAEGPLLLRCNRGEDLASPA